MKVDSLLGKKKHFNAADRKENYHHIMGKSLIVINTITGSSLLYIFISNFAGWLSYVPIVLAFSAAIISILQIYYRFCEAAAGHRRIANRYLSITKKCGRLEAYILDGMMKKEDIVKSVEDISIEIEIINKDAESYPTNREDLETSRRGIQSGEESYTVDELNL